MVAEQIGFALQGALESGLKDRTVDPNNAAQLRNMEAEAVRNNTALQSVSSTPLIATHSLSMTSTWATTAHSRC